MLAELDHLVRRYAEELGRREGIAVDGVAVFDALHRRHKVGDAILYGFDLLELDGENFQPLLLAERKTRLARLMAPAKGQDRRERALRRGRRYRISARLQDGPGGIVSKQLTVPYRSGPSWDWIKVKKS